MSDSSLPLMDPVGGIGLDNGSAGDSTDITLYQLISNLDQYFPEVFKYADHKAEELERLFTLPISFKEGSSIFKPFLGAIVLDLYKGFELGIKLYMIFVSVDFLIAVILSGVGMSMLSPTVISTPIKLAVFYFSDGWTILFNALDG